VEEGEVDCRQILGEAGCYHKPWWSWSVLKKEKLSKREAMKGVSELLSETFTLNHAAWTYYSCDDSSSMLHSQILYTH